MKALTNLNDNELVALIRKKKSCAEAAFNEIYRRHSTSIYGYCFSMVKSKEQAEDIFQDVFIKFYNHIDQNKNVDSVIALLITISRNSVANYLRNKKSFIFIDDPAIKLTENVNLFENTDLENEDMLNIILAALDQIEMKYREIFILKEIDGISYQEITLILGLSLPNAKSRVARAKMKLVEILSPLIKELNV